MRAPSPRQTPNLETNTVQIGRGLSKLRSLQQNREIGRQNYGAYLESAALLLRSFLDEIAAVI